MKGSDLVIDKEKEDFNLNKLLGRNADRAPSSLSDNTNALEMTP